MVRIGKKKKQETRDKILEHAKRMFFEDGYDETSTKKIAQAVGIAEGTIFNYFNKKADIILEIMNDEFFSIDDKSLLTFDLEDGIVETYISKIRRVLKNILRLPKKLLLQIFITLIKSNKSKPERLKRLVELDFKLIDYLETITKSFQTKGLMKNVDARQLAELIYSGILYEMMIYLYEKEYSKEKMYDCIEKKIRVLLKGYIIEE